MAKFRQTGNCRSNVLGGRRIGERYTQTIYSEPRKLLVGKELSPKGIRLFRLANSTEEKNLIWRKYGRNKYVLNPASTPVKTIYHIKNK